MTPEQVYAAYCAAVGGTTFDGRPLPTFDQLGDRQKDGWAAVAALTKDSA